MMGKVCAIKNCDSGRKRSRSKKNMPLLSFFQATETSQRLEKWTQCLGISLKKSDYICQLHFKDEDIKSYDNIIIDGKNNILPLNKKKLSEGALPTVEHQYICKSESPQQHTVPININCQPIQVYLNDSEKYQQQILNIRDKGMQQVFVEQPNYKDPLDTQESIKDFIDQMKNVSILPEYWFFSNKPNELVFIRVDPETKQIKHHIRLNHDLSITVICSNNKEVSVDIKITTLDDVYNYLKSVEKCPVCVGTLIDSKKFSKNCTGVIIGDESYQRMQMNPRCKSCRNLRNQLLARKSAVNSLLEKSIVSKSQAKKCKRLNTANMQFKKIIFLTKSECAKQSKIIVKREIKQLPNESNSIGVSSCFETAKKSNSHGRRYTFGMNK